MHFKSKRRSHCGAMWYTHKNAQVVTGLQNKLLQICSQTVAVCSHCLFPVVGTSLEQVVNNL
jgi:hypothetical protein